MYRTHTCGELRASHENSVVTLAGWVHKVRTHGALTFVDLRDRYGITQITINSDDKLDTDFTKESVIQIKGNVIKKPESNKALETGEIEVVATEVTILSRAKALPLALDNPETNEDTRLKYRYLDLRTKNMQNNLILRHKVTIAVREFFDKHDFLELETPVLGKSTPEGARDYLVPSRLHKGKFYALPQSPQIFKQLFQVSGLDKYMQIVKCFRDEDLRADRQPEFTQIDLEMSFVDEDDIYQLLEGMVKYVWKKTLNIEIPTPFPRISYKESMLRYGSDKPDVRFDLKIEDVTSWAKTTEFGVFKDAEVIRALKVGKDFSRKQIDKLTEVVKIYGAKGLAFLKTEDGTLTGGISKFVKDVPFEIKDGETVFFVADIERTAAPAIGALRTHLGKELGLINKDAWAFIWVTEFPLMEFSEERQSWGPMHHPFTSPTLEDRDMLKTNPEKCLSRAYDLALNGVELGGGSIRIHDRKLQEEVFDALKISPEEQEKKFGFMLGAFEYGAPPHGGLAFGLDRMLMLMAKADNIREVMAFPKNKDAIDLMMESPSEVSEDQLKELHLNIRD